MEIAEALRIARDLLSFPDREKLMAHSLTVHQVNQAYEVITALHELLVDPLAVLSRANPED